MLRDVAVAFLAAILALVGWGIREALQRSRRLKAVKAALAIEVATIAALVRANRYAAELRAHADQIRQRRRTFGYEIFIIQIGQSYFTVFEANASRLGELDASLVVEIVAFYQDARSLVDACSREAQPDTSITPAETAAKRYTDLAEAMDRLCAFADRLVAKLATSDVAAHIIQVADELRPEITSFVTNG